MHREEASRTNGGKGKGPTSTEGKARSRNNARKIGAFAKELVIPELGERPEDLEKVHLGIRSTFEPSNPVEAQLCDDMAVNWWRRERVRRCEAAEIRNAARKGNCPVAMDLDRNAALLKERFLRLVAEWMRATLRKEPRGDVRSSAEIQVDLDNVRWDLHRYSTGLDFLRRTLDPVLAEAEKGVLSPGSEMLLLACLGNADENATLALNINREIRKVSDELGRKERPPEDPSGHPPVEDSQTQTGKPDQRQAPAEKIREIGGALLLACVMAAQSDLTLQQATLRDIEEAAADDVQARAAAVLGSSQLVRPEASYDRRYYKALKTLYGIRFQQAQVELMQGRSSQLSQKAQVRRLRRSRTE